MRLWGNDYNKMEFAGAFGDLGTLIPFVGGSLFGRTDSLLGSPTSLVQSVRITDCYPSVWSGIDGELTGLFDNSDCRHLKKGHHFFSFCQ